MTSISSRSDSGVVSVDMMMEDGDLSLKVHQLFSGLLDGLETGVTGVYLVRPFLDFLFACGGGEEFV